MNNTFVLGAPDPEMVAIEGLLAGAGVPYVHATVSGKRCTADNAYHTDGSIPALPADAAVILVECGGAFFSRIAGVIDHHRRGDPGYGQPASNYWLASSIGQVFTYLGSALSELDSSDKDELLFTAAADHCLAAAYRGLCPDVNPDELMLWRVSSKAEFQRRPIPNIIADIDATRAALRAASACSPNAVGSAGWLPGASDQVIDFGDTTLPELPEAAAREGIAYLATVTAPGGRRKRVLGAASPSLVRAWMAGEGRALKELYGDPERGFAGGYLQS